MERNGLWVHMVSCSKYAAGCSLSLDLPTVGGKVTWQQSSANSQLLPTTIAAAYLCSSWVDSFSLPPTTSCGGMDEASATSLQCTGMIADGFSSPNLSTLQ